MSIEMRKSRETAAESDLSLSVVMCGYNEAENVEAAVRQVVAALERLKGDFEIIIVDDGSTDSMGRIADGLAESDSRVRVLHNQRNVNYGVSLLRGMEAARCDWIVHDGMDLPLAPEDIGNFVSYFVDSDVVVVRRLDRAAHSPWRMLTSVVNHGLLRALFAPRSRDLNFVQFYRRSFVRALRVVSTGPASVTPELILRAERCGARVREVSAVFRRRPAGRGHFGRPKDILWTLSDLLKLRAVTWLRGWER